MQRAIFLDRDGTLIKLISRIYFKHKFTAPFRFAELEFFPEVEVALARMKRLGFLRILTTNQPDVALGYILQDEWSAIQTAVERRCDLDHVFMCRHKPEEGCFFRKPSPGMLLSAADNYRIDLSRSYMIGDTEADMGAGKAARCTTILINAAYNQAVEANYRADNLHDACNIIESRSCSKR